MPTVGILYQYGYHKSSFTIYCAIDLSIEVRLHSKRSVGVGGHISTEDADLAGEAHPYEEGLRRELAEEVVIDTPYTDRCVGLINDDETEVGQVHLGVVHLFDVESPSVCPREAALHNAGFESLASLLADLESMESWSRICLEGLFVTPAP